MRHILDYLQYLVVCLKIQDKRQKEFSVFFAGLYYAVIMKEFR
jgi:hypothetical protein